MKKFKLITAIVMVGLVFVVGCQRTRGGQVTKPIQPKEFSVPAASVNEQKESPVSPAAGNLEIRSEGAPKQAVSTKPKTVARPMEAIGAAVLMVDQEHLTADDVLRRIRPELESIAATYNEDVYLRRAEGQIGQATRDLISEMLLYRQVSERISEEQQPVIDKVVEKEVTRLANQNAGGSMVRLEQQLKDQDSTLEILRDQLRRQIITQQYLRDAMKPKVAVTRQEMWSYYQQHKEEFCSPRQVQLFLIEIDAAKGLPEGTTWQMASSDQKRSAQTQVDRQIREAMTKLKAGEDFSAVAKAYSTGATGRLGGKLGWISRGSYRLKALEDKAFALNAGEVGEPITLGSKTYLVKVAERKAAKTTSFSQAQETVKGALEQQMYRQLVMEHLAKLWSRSQIGDLEPFMQAVYSRLPAYETMREKSLGNQSK